MSELLSYLAGAGVWRCVVRWLDFRFGTEAPVARVERDDGPVGIPVHVIGDPS